LRTFSAVFAEADAPSNRDIYRDGLYSTCDYFLGNNPLNQTWVTGLGERSPAHIFNLDSWVLGGETPRVGVTPYGPWSKEFLGFFTNSGPFDPKWAFERTYPLGEDNWPAHERWFNQRTAPLSTEYTVHQNMAPQILTYGYLYSLTAPDFVSGTQQVISKTYELYISPNPAIDDVRILGRDAIEIQSAKIFNSAGGQVLQTRVFDGQLNVRSLSAGVYSVTFTTNKGELISRKLIIE